MLPHVFPSVWALELMVDVGSVQRPRASFDDVLGEGEVHERQRRVPQRLEEQVHVVHVLSEHLIGGVVSVARREQLIVEWVRDAPPGALADSVCLVAAAIK